MQDVEQKDEMWEADNGGREEKKLIDDQEFCLLQGGDMLHGMWEKQEKGQGQSHQL